MASPSTRTECTPDGRDRPGPCTPPSPRRRWTADDVLNACILGNIETIQRVFRRNNEILFSIYGPDGSTPHLLACKHGHIELVRFFFSIGASVNDRDRDPKRQGNALHYAAWGGHMEMVEWLLDPEQGGSLDDVDIVGNTALLYAVYGGHRHVVNELLVRGRSLQERNSKNHTALLQAACGGHLHLVRWLLEQGFSLNEADHDGNTALLFAAWGGHLELIHFLLENGSNLNEQNHNGHSILLSAANGGRVEIVEWLLEQGFSLSETNNNGDTALLLAAYGGHRYLVERLLSLGASLDDKNACGFTPLLSAANGGQLEMSEWLLQHGAKLSEADYDGYTSLILAACGGNIELVKFFIRQGASITERNGNGDTALLLAAYCGNRELVDWLLSNGSSLQEKNDTGMGALISAANGGDVEVVELLLQRIAEAGPDCGDGIENTDEGGYTPLLLAAQRGHFEVVKLLTQYGANCRAETVLHHNTAFSLAVDFEEVSQYLAYVQHWRPMQIAADAKNYRRLLALIQAGVETVGYDGPSPMDLACTASQCTGAEPINADIIELLRNSRLPWCPARHMLFPRETRRSVFYTMLLIPRLSASEKIPALPSEMWMHIASFLGRGSSRLQATNRDIGWLPVVTDMEPPTSSSQPRPLSNATDSSIEFVDWYCDDDDDLLQADAGTRARNSTSKLRRRELFPSPDEDAMDMSDDESQGVGIKVDGRDDVGVLSFSSPRRYSWV